MKWKVYFELFAPKRKKEGAFSAERVRKSRRGIY